MSYVRAALVYLLCIIAAAGHSAAQDVDPTQDAKKANTRPAATATVSAEPFDNADVKTLASNCVRLETEAGAIEIELFAKSAPETARNFLNLVASGMYDTTTFHRIVPDFVIQGGSLATRSGPLTAAIMARSERRLADEPNKILHDRGIVSMARSDEANSATTSFFILMRREVRLGARRDHLDADDVARQMAPQQRRDAREQVRQADVLGEVVVRTEPQARNDVEIAVARGEEDDRQRGGERAQLAAQLEPRVGVAAQADAEDRKVGPARAHRGERLGARAVGAHLEAVLAQRLGVVRADGRIVLDDRDAAGHGKRL